VATIRWPSLVGGHVIAVSFQLVICPGTDWLGQIFNVFARKILLVSLLGHHFPFFAEQSEFKKLWKELAN